MSLGSLSRLLASVLIGILTEPSMAPLVLHLRSLAYVDDEGLRRGDLVLQRCRGNAAVASGEAIQIGVEIGQHVLIDGRLGAGGRLLAEVPVLTGRLAAFQALKPPVKFLTLV